MTNIREMLLSLARYRLPSRPERSQDEIERSVQAVRGRNLEHRTDKLIDLIWKRSQRRPISLFAPKQVLWGRRTKTNISQSVFVRGRVPREFFDWLEEQKQTDWKARKMLRNCFFEGPPVESKSNSWYGFPPVTRQ